MTAALDESTGAQRPLVADASHELRTPLTSLITNLSFHIEDVRLRHAYDLVMKVAAGELDQVEEIEAILQGATAPRQ